MGGWVALKFNPGKMIWWDADGLLAQREASKPVEKSMAEGSLRILFKSVIGVYPAFVQTGSKCEWEITQNYA